MRYILTLLPVVLMSFNLSVSAQEDAVADIKDGDIIKKENFTITFSKAKAEKILPLYPDQPIREKLVQKIDNSESAAGKIEKYLYKKTEGKYFKRSGKNLTLFLENGKKLVLTNPGTPEDDGDEYEGYSFEHFFEKNNFYLIRVQYYEGSAHMLVDRKSGAKEYIIGIPYFSPSGKRVLAISMDLEAAYDANGVQLLTLRDGSIKSEFILEPSSWGPVAAKWLNEHEVLLEKETIQYDKSSGNIAGYKKGYSKMTIK